MTYFPHALTDYQQLGICECENLSKFKVNKNVECLGGQWTLIQQKGDHCRSKWIVQWDHSNQGLNNLQPSII